MKLILEVEGKENSLRSVLQIVEELADGIAQRGTLSIERAVIIAASGGKIFTHPDYADKESRATKTVRA